MNQRFLITTFAGCTIVFAGVWAASAPTPQLVAAPAPDAAPAAMYADCAAVRAANAAPLRASQPGYRPALDPNMNGIACETVGAPDPAPQVAAPPPTDPGEAPDAQTPAPPPPGPIEPPPPATVREELPVLT